MRTIDPPGPSGTRHAPFALFQEIAEGGQLQSCEPQVPAVDARRCANRQEHSAASSKNLPAFSKNAIGCHVFGRQPWPNAARRHDPSLFWVFPVAANLR